MYSVFNFLHKDMRFVMLRYTRLQVIPSFQYRRQLCRMEF